MIEDTEGQHPWRPQPAPTEDADRRIGSPVASAPGGAERRFGTPAVDSGRSPPTSFCTSAGHSLAKDPRKRPSRVSHLPGNQGRPRAADR